MSIDFPRAWEIAKTVAPEYHHNDCSFNVTKGTILCDCDIVYKNAEYLDKDNFYSRGGIVIEPTSQSQERQQGVNIKTPLELAYNQGWLEAADWSDRDDLIYDMTSEAYREAMNDRLKNILKEIEIENRREDI